MPTQSQDLKTRRPAAVLAKAKFTRKTGVCASDYDQLAKQVSRLQEENSRLKNKIQFLQELCLMD
jgi:hypothetical protein